MSVPNLNGAVVKKESNGDFVSTGTRYQEYAKMLKEAYAKRLKEAAGTGHRNHHQMRQWIQMHQWIRQWIYCLEFCAIVHSIFIERLLNKDWKLTLKNIDSEQKEMKRCIQYFTDWIKEKEHYKKHEKDKQQIWKEYFFAEKMYQNLRIGIAGFFGHARAVLNLGNGAPNYVPGTFSSQSNLESYFSKVRGQKRDSVIKFHAAASADNCVKAIDEGVTPNDVLKKLKQHDTIFIEEWAGKRRKEQEQSELAYFPEEPQDTRSVFGKTIQGWLSERKLLQGSFGAFLVSDHLFQELAKLSMGTQQEQFFKTIVTGMMDQEKFNKACRQIIEKCCMALEEAAGKGRGSIQSNYHYLIYELLRSWLPGFMRVSLDLNLQNHLGVALLFQVLSRDMLVYIPTCISKEAQSGNGCSGEPTAAWKKAQAKDINRFLGWALFSLKAKLISNAPSRGPDTDGDAEDISKEDKVKLLFQTMITSETAILSNIEYLQKYYPLADRLLNRGGLTLVAPEYIELGHEILTVTSVNNDLSTISKQWNRFAGK